MRFEFNLFGAILFIVILLPNIVWAIFPTVDDVLRKDTNTFVLERVIQVVQVLLVVVLMLTKTDVVLTRSNFFWLVGIFVAIGLYYFNWLLYYYDVRAKIIYLSLCVFPTIAFIFYAVMSKNWLVMMIASMYGVLHLFFTAKNFLFESEDALDENIA